MWRRPHENNEKQHKGFNADRSRHCSPGHNRRQRAGSTADNDILLRGAFQPDRIDHDIKENRESQQAGSQHVCYKTQNHDGQCGHEHAEAQSLVT